jgi:hypothetical protein
MRLIFSIRLGLLEITQIFLVTRQQKLNHAIFEKLDFVNKYQVFKQ